MRRRRDPADETINQPTAKSTDQINRSSHQQIRSTDRHINRSTDLTLMLDTPQSTQMVLREGFCEFTWGQPDAALLPVEAMQRATGAALAAFGPDALAYGAAEGAVPLLAWITERVAHTEGLAVNLDECIGTAGNSDALDQICTLFSSPGDIALVESPTYHLAVRILHDHRLDLRAVPVDEHGLQVDVLRAMLDDLSRAGQRARLLYTIPTFHNPTGVNLTRERRRALVEVAVEHGLLILEDDVYRELAYDEPSPPSLFGLAPRGTVLRLGSFSKTLAPGLRLGWINGAAAQLRRIVDGGLRDSGGGPSFYTGMMVAGLCRAGDFDTQVSRLKSAYMTRRDALAGALAESLPEGCTFVKPGGGFFLWVTLPAHVNAEDLLKRAETHKVTFIPGNRFCLDGRGRNQLRLAFSRMRPEELVEGARRLTAAIGS
jgi:DNA-binding transcriptional MocR family regulator